MKLKLTRLESRAEGIFGILEDGEGTHIAYTLEHAYQLPSGAYEPKVGVGNYTCKRSMHRLHGMTSDFETFQVMDVPGHSNILFHWGNYNSDSDGCILVGAAEVGNMITSSKLTFAKLMHMLDGLQEIKLEVI